VNREYHRWYSPSLSRDMELLVFGHGGARVLVFPTSMGRFFEWEDRDMIGALGDHVGRGWLQLYCVDSVDGESWYNRRAHPHDRAWRHQQYEDYIVREVMPFAWHRNPTPFTIATGASFGAYHALNLALRHPHLINRVLALAGLYDIKRMTGGYSDDLVYAHDPSHFLMHERDGRRLDAMHQINIILAIGKDDPNRQDNEHLSNLLWSKGIWHALRLWDGWCHDWPWWREMVVKYVGGND
jgi:esterase/lipase superfamily enzyme